MIRIRLIEHPVGEPANGILYYENAEAKYNIVIEDYCEFSKAYVEIPIWLDGELYKKD